MNLVGHLEKSNLWRRALHRRFGRVGSWLSNDIGIDHFYPDINTCRDARDGVRNVPTLLGQHRQLSKCGLSRRLPISVEVWWLSGPADLGFRPTTPTLEELRLFLVDGLATSSHENNVSGYKGFPRIPGLMRCIVFNSRAKHSLSGQGHPDFCHAP